MNITASSLLTESQQTAGSANKLAQDFDDFLVLLTTQLQNQDPLSPMESTEFTNQLVGFSQVEQQINQNDKLNQLLQLQYASANSMALQYVGMDVSFVGNQLYHDGASQSEIFYSLEDNANSSKIRIVNAEGVTVRQLDANRAAGTDSIVWDGLDKDGQALPAGNYTVAVDALDDEGNAIKGSTAVTGSVKGIESQNGVTYLLVKGDRLVSINEVLSASLPQPAATDETETPSETEPEGEEDDA